MRYALTTKQSDGLLALIAMNGLLQIAVDLNLHGVDGDVTPVVERVVDNDADLRGLRRGQQQVSHNSLVKLLPFLWRVDREGFVFDRYRTPTELLDSANGLGSAVVAANF